MNSQLRAGEQYITPRRLQSQHNIRSAIKTFKLETIKMWKSRRKSKPRRTDSSRSLMENNNNDTQDGNNPAGVGYDNFSAQNALNTHEEQRLQSVDLSEVKLQELTERLGVTPGANTSENGSCCSMRPETISGQQNPKSLIECFVRQRFPKTPADLEQNLPQHLLNVQETVHNMLVKPDPLLKTMGLMDCLIDCCHRQTFEHLDELLQDSRSSQSCLVLMQWVLRSYLSQELLGHPDFQEINPINKVDLLLCTEWVVKAKDKLLANVQKEVRGSLEKILQNERSQEGCLEEAYVQLYVDTVQCIDAMPKAAQHISSKLSDDVREVCFQELQTFVERYTSEQTEILRKTAKMSKRETTEFFKTLNTCKELRQHIQNKGKSRSGSLLQETVEMLENMEAFTLKLLMEIVADIAERNLKNYFKRENKEFFLILEVKECFPKLMWCQDVQKRVMDETYKLIVHIYLKHLVQISQTKLMKCWSPDVGQTVAEDAEQLHHIISVLAPGVQQWNLMLLKITELLECKSIEAMKLTVASMQKDCPTLREDMDLLPALLRWKGLSRGKVREVRDAIPREQLRPRSVSCYSCLICW